MTSQILSLNGSDWKFKSYIGEDWLWRSAHKPDTRDVRGWYPATVPGSVQTDLWRAGLAPDPYQEMNSLQIEWAPERTWIYKRTFTVDPAVEGRRVQLVFEGVDYAARYYLNGVLVGRSKGTYLPAAFEIGGRLKYGEENLLAVVIDPAPFEQPQIGYTSKVYTQKSRMTYWWDFCPRMVHVGIWQDVYLRVTGPARIEDVWARPVLNANLDHASVDVTVVIDSHTAVDEVEVLLRRDGSGDVLGRAAAAVSTRERARAADVGTGQATEAQAVENVARQLAEAKARFEIDHPDVWWPNGHGAQPLYEVEVIARADGQDSDTRRVPFGIRTVEFLPNEDASPDLPGYTLTVNGRRMYIKGWNWVPVDVQYGVEYPEKREHLLRLAQAAQVNLLRVWGGGLIEKEAFYRLCDRLGIMVWQEFIQSSSGIDNYPSLDPGFIAFLVKNAESAIRLRRNHPSLAAWCGGNELHYAGDDLVDERHPALAALYATVRRLDPGRPWFPSSPSGGHFGFEVPQSAEMAARMGDVHGPWEYQGLRKQYTLYNGGESLFHSEFGVEGLTNARALNRTIAPEHQWPVSLDNPIWHHLGAWWVKEKVWQEVFGEMPDVATTLRATQFTQADGLRYALEADRRRAFHNSGTMPWQFNEPYPMAACTSAVDYYAEPKPVYYTVARAYAPVSVTAKFAALAWTGETAFEAEIWVANDRSELQGEVVARILGIHGDVWDETTHRVICAENRSQAVGSVRLPLERIPGPVFFLDLLLTDNQGQALAANRYIFTTAESLAPMLSAPPAQVTAQVEKSGAEAWEISLQNPSDTAALWVWLEADKPDLRTSEYARFSDNYFCLMPGESKRIQVLWDNVPEPGRALSVSGWNIPELHLS